MYCLNKDMPFTTTSTGSLNTSFAFNSDRGHVELLYKLTNCISQFPSKLYPCRLSSGFRVFATDLVFALNRGFLGNVISKSASGYIFSAHLTRGTHHHKLSTNLCKHRQLFKLIKHWLGFVY